METIRAVRGMHDTLPDAVSGWRRLERVAERVLESYGYREIRFPLVEKTELFERTIGKLTDIVSKEMYTFADRNGERLTLRPEGTAGCVRAGIEHGLLQGVAQRLWYVGPMFRHERPQKARFRQFHQVGAEAFGLPGPDIDAELIALSARLWRELQIDGLRLEINNLGDAQTRQRYRGKLVDYFEAYVQALNEDERERLARNPLRILDSKNPALKAIIEGAPTLDAFLDGGSREHFAELRRMLDHIGVLHVVNPRLVRGLDYYGGTVFEWASTRLGAQGAVCAGGRYDTLVETIGGKPTPAIGFALGIERLLELIGSGPAPAGEPHAYLVVAEAAAQARALQLAEQLRDRLPQLRLVVHCGKGTVKSQFKKADRSGAWLALVLGEEELRAETITIKPLRGQGEQRTVAWEAAATELGRSLGF